MQDDGMLSGNCNFALASPLRLARRMPGRARCVSSARRDLHGRRGAILVPTGTSPPSCSLRVQSPGSTLPGSWGCKGPIAKETFVMNRGILVVASLVVMGSMLVGGQPATAAPALSADQALRGEVIVQQVQYRYCRGWHRECSYRWGYGWLYRRCMRRHGC